MLVTLQAGDLGSGTTDVLYLDDQINYRIPITPIQAGSQTIPGGIGFGVHERGIYRTQLQSTTPGTREILLPLLVSGINMNAAFGNWTAVDQKLEQARRAQGAFGQGGRVCLLVQFDGASQPVVFDIVDGSLLPADLALPDGDVWLGGLLSLTVYPYTRSMPKTYSAGAQITLAGTLYQAGIPGSVDSMLTLQFADGSSGGTYMQRLRGARKSLRPLGATDFTGLYSLVVSGAGSSGSDGTQYGAQYRRLATTASWQTFAKVTSDAGIRNSGLYDLFLRVRDSSAIVGVDILTAPTIQAGSGSLQPGTYTFFTVAKNGSNYAQISGAVSATLTTILAGGSTIVPTNILFYDNDSTADARYWTEIDPTMIANVAHTIWDSSSHNVFDFASAVDGSAAAGFATFTAGSSALSYIILPKLTSSTTGIVSLRIRFKLTATPRKPSTAGNYNPIIQTTDVNGVLLCGVNAHNTGGVQDTAIAANSVIKTIAGTLNDGAWHVLEITYDTTKVLISVVTSLDGVPYVATQGASVNIPAILYIAGSNNSGGLYIGEIVVADQALGSSLSVVGGSAATVGFTAGLNATSHDLFVAKDNQAGYYKVALGNVSSYQLTQWPPPSATLQAYPTSNNPTLPSEVRCEVSVNGNNVQPVPGMAVSAQIARSAWELLYLGTYPLAPVVTPEGGTYPAWQLLFQGKNIGPGSPTLDGDLLVVFPHNEDQFILEYPGGKALNAALQTWQLDTRYDGRVSGLLLDGSSVVQGTLDATGCMYAGAGDNLFIFVAETQDANGNWITDAVNTKFTPQIKAVRPMYHYAIGQQV